MSNLADRYVWGVLRAVPERQRADLEPEIRALVADAVDARAADDTNPAAAERAALTELGDPEALAARYTDRTLYLVGPSYFPDYRRLLMLLLAIVVPITTLSVLYAGAISGTGLGKLALDAVAVGFNVGIQLAFWVTLAFALVERYGRRTASPAAWTPDRLPALPAPSRLTLGEAVLSALGSAFVIGVILWRPPFYVDGTTVAFFDPALGDFWFPWFIVIAVLEIVFTVALYAARRWTWTFAAANAVLAAAFAIPAIWLLQERLVLSPDAVTRLQAIGAGASIDPTTAVVTVAIAAIAAWDAINGFLKARRSVTGAA
jgi:hypothetical protein